MSYYTLTGNQPNLEATIENLPKLTHLRVSGYRTIWAFDTKPSPIPIKSLCVGPGVMHIRSARFRDKALPGSTTTHLDQTMCTLPGRPAHMSCDNVIVSIREHVDTLQHYVIRSFDNRNYLNFTTKQATYDPEMQRILIELGRVPNLETLLIDGGGILACVAILSFPKLRHLGIHIRNYDNVDIPNPRFNTTKSGVSLCDCVTGNL